MSTWVPGRMEQERALQAPRPGLPDDIALALLRWLESTLRADTDTFYRLALYIQQPVGDPRQEVFGRSWEALGVWLSHDRLRVLDLIHHLLGDEYAHCDREALNEIFIQSNSLYRVNDEWDGLTEVIPEGVIDQVKETVEHAEPSVSKLLTNAWNAAYGYDKNPKHAFEEAIRAAETALRPIVGGATIFRMIDNMAKRPGDWEFVLTDQRPSASPAAPAADGVKTITDLMRLLAHGQRGRHGGEGDHEETEAKTAVLLAVALVQIAQSGALSRSSPS